MYNHDLRPQIIQCLLGNLSKYDFKELFTHSCAMMYLMLRANIMSLGKNIKSSSEDKLTYRKRKNNNYCLPLLKGRHYKINKRRGNISF
jgi:hypothetical protein